MPATHLPDLNPRVTAVTAFVPPRGIRHLCGERSLVHSPPPHRQKTTPLHPGRRCAGFTVPLPPGARILDAGLAFFSHSDTQGRPPNPTVFFFGKTEHPSRLACIAFRLIGWFRWFLTLSLGHQPSLGAPRSCSMPGCSRRPPTTPHPLSPEPDALFPSSWITSFCGKTTIFCFRLSARHHPALPIVEKEVLRKNTHRVTIEELSIMILNTPSFSILPAAAHFWTQSVGLCQASV